MRHRLSNDSRNLLNLVFQTKVENVETKSGPGNIRLKYKYVEKWENKVYFHETNGYQGFAESAVFSVHFGTVNDFIPSDNLNCTGYCEASRIFAYPDPAVSASPCVHSNMSMPSNGYLEFHHWTRLVSHPDCNVE